MKLSKILEEKNNELLARKEIKVIVEASKNPSIDESVSFIAENFKANKDSIAIKTIKGKFGRNTFLIEAFAYKSKDEKEKIEPKKKVKKGAELSQETAQPAQTIPQTQQVQEQKK